MSDLFVKRIPRVPPRLLWKKSIAMPGWEDVTRILPCWGPHDTILVTSMPPEYLICYDQEGNELWRFGGRNQYVGSPLVTPEGGLWVKWDDGSNHGGDRNGAIVRLDEHGKMLARSEQWYYQRLYFARNGLLYTMAFNYGEHSELEKRYTLRLHQLDNLGGVHWDLPLGFSNSDIYPACIDAEGALHIGAQNSVIRLRREDIAEVYGYGPEIKGTAKHTIGPRPGFEDMQVTALAACRKGPVVSVWVQSSRAGGVTSATTDIRCDPPGWVEPISSETAFWDGSFALLDDDSVLASNAATWQIVFTRFTPEGKKTVYGLSRKRTRFLHWDCDSEGKILLQSHSAESETCDLQLVEPVSQLFGNKLREHWRVSLPIREADGANDPTGPAIGPNGMVFFSALDGYLYAFGA